MITTEEIFIGNCLINKIAKQSRDTFLQNLSHIKYIRTRPLKAFSILPITEEDWIAIDRFYAIVNKGDFGLKANFPNDRPSSKIFGLYIPIGLYKWFFNADLKTIQKQILLYCATIYYFNNIPKGLFTPLYNEIKKLIEKYYLDKDKDISSLLKDAALDYCNTQMPTFISPFAIDAEEKEDIYVRTAYFNCFDWNYFVLNKVTKWYAWAYFNERVGLKPNSNEEHKLIDIPEVFRKEIHKDRLKRSESDQETWSKWLMTFRRYPISKSHIYSLYCEESAAGYIYVFRSGLSNRYKIGWTSDGNIEKRKASLQTGSSEPLIIIEFFPVGGRKAEKSIHNIFSKNRISGEWFELTEEELANLLSLDWRRENNIF